MHFEQKLVSSQKFFFKDFTHLKLIISNIVKTKQLPENKISPVNGVLLNGVLIANFLNNPLLDF